MHLIDANGCARGQLQVGMGILGDLCCDVGQVSWQLCVPSMPTSSKILIVSVGQGGTQVAIIILCRNGRRASVTCNIPIKTKLVFSNKGLLNRWDSTIQLSSKYSCLRLRYERFLFWKEWNERSFTKGVHHANCVFGLPGWRLWRMIWHLVHLSILMRNTHARLIRAEVRFRSCSYAAWGLIRRLNLDITRFMVGIGGMKQVQGFIVAMCFLAMCHNQGLYAPR
mmetsp:Transcript_54188/g.100120  ORF Transcript_54188/g.100120 Transcript_54188/m.100120 type:complete len:224 (+) Transcript_54188:164-835(+)